MRIVQFEFRREVDLRLFYIFDIAGLGDSIYQRGRIIGAEAVAHQTAVDGECSYRSAESFGLRRWKRLDLYRCGVGADFDVALLWRAHVEKPMLTLSYCTTLMS